MKNIGKYDAIVRVILALVVATLIITGTVSGLVAIALIFVSAWSLMNAFVGACPIYDFFGISTYRKHS